MNGGIAGDKNKLKLISAVWASHYECLSRAALEARERGRGRGRGRAVAMATLRGAPARLPCRLCVAPTDRHLLTWAYAPSLDKRFEPLRAARRRAVAADGSLTIHDSRIADSGVYQCRVGPTGGGPVFLDVADDADGYDVVEADAGGGVRDALVSVGGRALRVGTTWAAWSQCSACRRPGRRRRHGTCTLHLEPLANSENADYVETENLFDDNISRIFEGVYLLTVQASISHSIINGCGVSAGLGGGIPCRSRRLRALPALAALGGRRPLLALQLCQASHPRSLPQGSSGRKFKKSRTNNNVVLTTSGLPQEECREEPAVEARTWRTWRTPRTRVVFAELGAPLQLACPGEITRDIPLTWYADRTRITFRRSERMYVDPMDRLVFVTLHPADTTLYRYLIFTLFYGRL
ncbi:hypothetical protein ACJJTC_005706 [Scirpophaga incertulas]